MRKDLFRIRHILFIIMIVISALAYSQMTFAKRIEINKNQIIKAKKDVQQKQQVENILYQLSENLNSDDQIDKIVLIYDNNKKRYYLRINEATYLFKNNVLNIGNVSVVDIRANDGYKELLVEYKMSKSTMYDLFYYDGKNIKELLNITSKPVFLGNGEVIAETDMGFWTKKDIYILNDNGAGGQKVLILSPQELYDVNIKVVVKKPFKLYTYRDSKRVVTIAEKSETIEIISCDPSNWFKDINQKNNKLFDWYLIKTDKGIQGWARLKDFINSVDWAKKTR